MEKIEIGSSGISCSRLVYGCMRLIGEGSTEALKNGKKSIHSAIDAGFNHFDHADIYGKGSCETLFGEVLRESPQLRDQIILTSKCGVIFPNDPTPGDPGRYRLDAQHIESSIDGILTRLQTDHLDFYLLHRPDYLMQAEEIAKSLEKIVNQGKTKAIGVSNFSYSQVEMLRSHLNIPIQVHQMEVNIHNISAFHNGTLDQCQQHNISPQAWCPLGGIVYPAWGNTFSEDDEVRIQTEVERQCSKYEIEPWILILAWVLKHPARIFPIVGSTNADRIKLAPTALNLAKIYSRKDWYALLEARNGHKVP
ncbi:MAG: aldo/keto reductase [Opitutales bacterium]|nr:aldo/keto reductase [Opitutales bacterium]